MRHPHRAGPGGESNALDYLITGIGVNVNQRTEDFLPEVRPIAVSLAQELGRPVRRAELGGGDHSGTGPDVRRISGQQSGVSGPVPGGLPDPGQPGAADHPRLPGGGLCLEIDDQFRLVVEYPDGRRAALSAGVVSVRGNVWLCVRPEECGTGDKMDKTHGNSCVFPLNLPFAQISL